MFTNIKMPPHDRLKNWTVQENSQFVNLILREFNVEERQAWQKVIDSYVC